MIITLTKAYDDTTPITKVYINPDHIVRIKSEYAVGTLDVCGYLLYMINHEQIYVKESPDSINRIVAGQILHDVVFKDE